MYENYFGLEHRPFSAVARIDDYFPAESIESARSTLIRVAQRGEGIGLIIGAPGNGKTLLCQRIEHDVEDLFRVIILGQGHGVESRRELYQSLLFELGLKYAGLDEGELRLALLRHLTRTGSSLPLLLIVDDAQRLENELLDELRRITEISRDGAPAVQLILAGTGRLEEKFTHPSLESFNQRIAARCYLETFNHEETRGYLAARIGNAGGVLDTLITADAIESIYRATDGVPRLINQLADQALMLAASQNARPIWARLVDQAWAELQQLPAPWNETHIEGSCESSGGVVEFGSLGSDEDVLAADLAASESVVEYAETNISPADFEMPATCEEEATTSDEDTVADVERTSLHDLVLPNDLEDMFRELAEGDALPADEIPDPSELSLDVETVEALEETAPVEPVEPEDAPAAEVFLEEEIVLDRYAALDACGGRPLPKVYSVEGRELSALLNANLPAEPAAEPIEQAVEAPQAEQFSEPVSAETDEIEMEPPVELDTEHFGELSENCSADEELELVAEAELPAESDSQFDFEVELPIPASMLEDVDLPSPEAEVDSELVADDEPNVIRAIAEPAAADIEDAPTGDCDDDADLIVIDDEEEHQSGTVPLVAVSPVRREEYRTMFSRLRRGRVQS